MKPLALLLFPPIYDFASYDLFLKPYSLLKLGKWLEKSGFRVRLVNALDYRDPATRRLLGSPRRDGGGTGKFFRQVIEKPAVLREIPRSYARYGILRDVLEGRICEEKPEVVFISSGMTYWYPGVVEAVQCVKHSFPGTPVVLGGIYATLLSGHAEKHSGADYVVRGDAFPEVRNILESLSLPCYSEPPDEELLLLPEANPEAGVIRLNRGCPFRCRYCSSYVLDRGFQGGNPEAAFQTVREMNSRFGTVSFAFYDDALLVRKEVGIVPFLERILSSGLKPSFYLPNAVHLCFLDKDLACLMKRAGFCEIRLGFESAYPDFHLSMDNKLKPGMLEEGIELLISAGFTHKEISVYVLAGLPGQHWKEVEESIRCAGSLGVKVRLAEYSPVPGSPLWETSVQASRFPLSEEPVTHNNSIFPLEWEGFTYDKLNMLKRLATGLSAAGNIIHPRSKSLRSRSPGRET